MTGKNFTILFFFSFFVFVLAAQEDLSFYDFVAEDGSGLLKLQEMHNKKVAAKKVYTTQDTLKDVYEQKKLVSILLNEAVIKKVEELPLDKGTIVFKSHQKWLKYFKKVPSLPDINGSGRGIYSLAMDFCRIKNRYEALKLSYQQYLIYAEIANTCRVRLDHGSYKMQFGEVCLKKEACWAHDEEAVKTFGKYYYEFPVNILPETCCKIPPYYFCVLNSYRKFYLCIWNDQGIPFAVHPLPETKKILSASFAKGNHIEVTYENNRKRQETVRFIINKPNQIRISKP